MAFKGEAITITTVKITAATEPMARAVSDLRISAKSNKASEKPKPRIGFIKGEMSIAPMTTAGDDTRRPSTAMPADIIVMNA